MEFTDTSGASSLNGVNSPRRIIKTVAYGGDAFQLLRRLHWFTMKTNEVMRRSV
jgi:hypothetical protein